MISLSEVHTSLSLFAEAIHGEPVAFAVGDGESACWPWGHETPADGVILPPALESRPFYRFVLLHQLLKQQVPSTGRSALFEKLVDIAENHRVTGQIRREYPGAVVDMEQVLVHASDRGASRLPEADDADTASGVFLRALRLHTLGATNFERTSARNASAISLLDRMHHPDATPETSLRIARLLLHLIDGSVPAQDSLVGLAELEEDPETQGLESEASTGVSLDGGTPNEVVDGQGSSSGQLTSDLSDQAQSASEADENDSLTAGLTLPTVGTRLPSDGSRTFIYDEWDYHQKSHRPAWCRVVEERLVGDDHEFIVDVRRRHQQLRSQIRHRLLRLPAQNLVRVHRSLDGDELDLDAAIEAVVDRRSGAPVDDRLQIRRDRAGRDVATAFLVDLSASTSSPAVPPEPVVVEASSDPFDDPMSYGPIWDAPRTVEPIRRVIDVAKDAVALMGDALQDLGDRYAVYGFSGTGRDHVEFKIGKDFADRANASSWASIAEMKPLRYTRMGPAIRHASAKLQAVGAQTKLLIVISDGYPQDVDYGADRNDRDYGMHDTARALADAERVGIGTFCVTIDPAGHDYLRDMCPDGRYLVIDDVESLPEELAKLYLGNVGGP